MGSESAIWERRPAKGRAYRPSIALSEQPGVAGDAACDRAEVALSAWSFYQIIAFGVAPDTQGQLLANLILPKYRPMERQGNPRNCPPRRSAGSSPLSSCLKNAGTRAFPPASSGRNRASFPAYSGLSRAKWAGKCALLPASTLRANGKL